MAKKTNKTQEELQLEHFRNRIAYIKEHGDEDPDNFGASKEKVEKIIEELSEKMAASKGKVTFLDVADYLCDVELDKQQIDEIYTALG